MSRLASRPNSVRNAAGDPQPRRIERPNWTRGCAGGVIQSNLPRFCCILEGYSLEVAQEMDRLGLGQYVQKLLTELLASLRLVDDSLDPEEVVDSPLLSRIRSLAAELLFQAPFKGNIRIWVFNGTRNASLMALSPILGRGRGMGFENTGWAGMLAAYPLGAPLIEWALAGDYFKPKFPLAPAQSSSRISQRPPRALPLRRWAAIAKLENKIRR